MESIEQHKNYLICFPFYLWNLRKLTEFKFKSQSYIQLSKVIIFNLEFINQSCSIRSLSYDWLWSMEGVLKACKYGLELGIFLHSIRQ